MSIYVLFIWTVVGVGGTSYSVLREFDWRALGEFRGEHACVESAKQLNIKPEKFRCVNTGRPAGEKQ